MSNVNILSYSTPENNIRKVVSEDDEIEKCKLSPIIKPKRLSAKQKFIAISHFIISYKYLNIKQESCLVTHIAEHHPYLAQSEYLKKWDRSILSCDANPIASFLRLPMDLVLKSLFSLEMRNYFAKTYIEKVRPTNKISTVENHLQNLQRKSYFCQLVSCECFSTFAENGVESCEDQLIEGFCVLNTLNPYFGLLVSISKYCGILVKNLSKGMDLKLLNKQEKYIPNSDSRENDDETSLDEIHLDQKKTQKLWKYGIPPMRPVRRAVLYWAIMTSLKAEYQLDNLDIYLNDMTYDRLKKKISKMTYLIVPKYKVDLRNLLKKWLQHRGRKVITDTQKIIYQKDKIIWNIDIVYSTIIEALSADILPHLKKNINTTVSHSNYLGHLHNTIAKQLLCCLVYLATYESIFAITAILL